MRSAPAVSLEGVAKGYRMYANPGDRLRELFVRRPLHQVHWALQEVDIRIEPGETFGVIGENGAGKSTLLKLVAGTSPATHGRVAVNGRVAALLELGAGFHPEENGRDNVYLMGALAGIPRRRMESYYAEIAEFSELSAEVLARPMKTYSSGMFMRLAFAVATAVEPDVLIVDEALSVGDLHFQKKSLNRIMGFREAGKTVLFCSHNLYQVRSLCSRAVWLDGGRIRAIGSTEEVATAYESYEREKELAARPVEAGGASVPMPGAEDGGEGPSPAQPRTTAPVRLREVSIEDSSGARMVRLESFEDCTVWVETESFGPTPFHVGIVIQRNDGENVFGTGTHLREGGEALRATGRSRVGLRFPSLGLLSGEYRVAVYILDDTGIQVFDLAERVYPFTVHNRGREVGIAHLSHQWMISGG